MAQVNPGVQTEHTPSKAMQAANAIFALMIAVIFALGFFGALVYYVVHAVEDRAALTIIFCFVGLAVIVAVLCVAGFGLYYVRNLGASLVEHQSRDNQAMQTAFVQLVAETRKTNDINLQLLNAAMNGKQLPAPTRVSDGSGTFPIYNRGVEVGHNLQPAQPAGWAYRLPDGQQARGDLIEAIVRHGWDAYDSAQFPDLRSYVREVSSVGFRNDAYRLALEALKREGVCDESGRFTVNQPEAQRLLTLMRARAR
jgi:TM2 domain-containing membrane protein YozV